MKLLVETQHRSVCFSCIVLKLFASVTMQQNYGNLFQNCCIFSPTSTVFLLVIFKLDIYKVLCAQTHFFVHCNTYLCLIDCRVQGQIKLLSFLFFLKQYTNSVHWFKTKLNSFTCAEITYFHNNYIFIFIQ